MKRISALVNMGGPLIRFGMLAAGTSLLVLLETACNIRPVLGPAPTPTPFGETEITEVAHLPLCCFDLAYSPDGKSLAVASYTTVAVFDLEMDRLRWQADHVEYDHSRRVIGVQWSPNGSLLASWGEFGKIHVWDAATGARQAFPESPDMAIRALTWSADGQRPQLALVRLEDSTLGLWDLEAQASAMEFTVDERVWTSASLSPDAGLLAGIYLSGPVLVWDVITGQLLPNWPQNIDEAGMDAPATTNLVSVDRQTFRSLDASRIIFEPQVVWSPDGSWLATAAREREVVWEVRSGSGKLLGESNAVALAWSPDGRLLAAVEYPGTLRIWEVSTGAELLARFGLQAGPTQLDWSVTGDELAFNLSDGTLLRWRIPAELIGSR